MPRGFCKTLNGWGNQGSAWVQYDDGTQLEVSEDRYREQGYSPEFDDLPACQGQQNATRT